MPAWWDRVSLTNTAATSSLLVRVPTAVAEAGAGVPAFDRRRHRHRQRRVDEAILVEEWYVMLLMLLLLRVDVVAWSARVD